MLAGGDVRLQASASSAADLQDTVLGGSITGDGTVGGDTANPASDIAIGVLGDLILLADGSVGTALHPLRIQIAPTGSLSMNVVDDLYLTRFRARRWTSTTRIRRRTPRRSIRRRAASR